ncbi:8350_t:CDS:1, partial [Funneliformis geosporum]
IHEKRIVNQQELIAPTKDIHDEVKPSEPIIRTDLIPQDHIISKGRIHDGLYIGTLYEKKIIEKIVGIFTTNSVKFAEFKKEMTYLRNLSDDCTNILSVKGYTERNVLSLPFDKDISILRYLMDQWYKIFNNEHEYVITLVTECADYNLPDYVKGNKIGWRTKISIARGIANALNFIHSSNLLHYNLKSDSVFLNQKLEPKLFNFGKNSGECVVLKSTKSIELSNRSAPEVKREGKYTSASEVYNFGVILWEIATQECLSGDKSIDNRNIDDAPPVYLSLIEKAMDQDPQNRPTMQEILDSLKQLEYSQNVPDQEKEKPPTLRKLMKMIYTYFAS